MKIVFASGGTGGHVYPALALADYIMQQDNAAECIFVGSSTRIEKDIISKTNYQFVGLDIPSVYSFMTRIRLAFKLPFAYRKARILLKKERPDIVIGTGGFISYPTVKAAQSLKIPTILHEQNAVIGKANAKLFALSNAMVTCYEDVLKDQDRNKVYLFGNPRATQVANMICGEVCEYDVLIFMGSQGSSIIDTFILNNIDLIASQSFKTLYVCGKQYINNYTDTELHNLKIKAYDDDMLNTMMSSRLIVCRAGATSLSELCVIGHPMILIPSPHVVDNHQHLNALQLAQRDACKLLPESDLTANYLIESILEILEDTKLQMTMQENLKYFAKPNASQDIYHLIMKTIKGE